MSLYHIHMHAWCLRKPEDGIRFPETRLTDHCELPCVRWELNVSSPTAGAVSHCTVPPAWCVYLQPQHWWSRQADVSVDQGGICASTSASHVMGLKVYFPMLSLSLDFILFSYHFYYTYMYLYMHGP